MSLFGGGGHITPFNEDMKVEYINSTQHIMKDMETLLDYLMRFDAVLYEETKETINNEIANLAAMITMVHSNPKMVVRKQ